MYYQNYEDYIRSILGYPTQMQNTYRNDLNQEYEYISQEPRYSGEILELYPEIYKIVNPMVCKICETNTKPITRELIEKMTEEIYANLENDPCMNEIETVNVSVSLPENKKERVENKVAYTKSPLKSNEEMKKNTENREMKKELVPENREHKQVRRNRMLQDLIKILILNQLLGKNFKPPRPRPQFPIESRPNYRPPFSGTIGINPISTIRPRENYNL